MPRKFKLDESDNLCGTLFAPDSEWVPPPSFPNLSGERRIGLDIETRDPDLHTRGPGFIRGGATVVGISVAAADKAWYYPFGHLGGGNVEKEPVIRWVRDLVSDPSRYIVGANLQYELEGLESLGIVMASRTLDIQVAEALIDEEKDHYALEHLAREHLGSGKDETLLRDAASAYGVDPKSGLWKLPSKYVGPYAEYDSLAALRIFEKQYDRLRKDDLLGIFELESKLLPILWQMRKQGIPIDMDAAGVLSDELKLQEENLRMELIKAVGYDLDVWSADQISRFCDKVDIRYPRTEKGNPSFTGDWLDAYSDPRIQLIAKIREVNRMKSTFVDKWIFKNQVNGRIHPQWKQLASDDGGTRTGRMACANPNAQQVPAAKFRMTGEPNPIGKAIRACFVSDKGPWAKFDYSQQEPRILTHFAAICKFPGAIEVRDKYRSDRDFDVYKHMVEIAKIDRRPAKDMYLARCYGMGIDKLATKLGRSTEEAKRILDEFDTHIPFVKAIQESCEKTAQARGYIKTLLGRKRHFNKWQPFDSYQRKKNDEYIVPLSKEMAETKWPKVRLVRSDTRKALNSLIQGSAADMTKAALIAIYEHDGTIPYMQVHDELDIGVRDKEHANELHKIIETCVDMTVPIKSDMSLGKCWK